MSITSFSRNRPFLLVLVSLCGFFVIVSSGGGDGTGDAAAAAGAAPAAVSLQGQQQHQQQQSPTTTRERLLLLQGGNNSNTNTNNTLEVEDCDSATIVPFTSYLRISGDFFLFQEEEDEMIDNVTADPQQYDLLLVSTLIDTYNEYSETICSGNDDEETNPRGGTLIEGATILRKEDGDILVGVNATCVGCVFERDLVLFNYHRNATDDEESNIGVRARSRLLANSMIAEPRWLQEEAGANATSTNSTTANSTAMDQVVTNVTMEEQSTEAGANATSTNSTTTTTNTTMDQIETNITMEEPSMPHQQAPCYCEPPLQATFADTLQEALVVQGMIVVSTEEKPVPEDEEQTFTFFDVIEVSEPVACNDDSSLGDLVTTNFTQIVLVDFVVSCNLVDADSDILANVFVDIYNAMQQREYCDPYHRRLSSARVIRRGETRSDDSALTIELELVGTCRGCDPDVDGFYDPLVDVLIEENVISINQAINTEINGISLNTTNTTDFNTTTNITNNIDVNTTDFNTTTNTTNNIDVNTTDFNTTTNITNNIDVNTTDFNTTTNITNNIDVNTTDFNYSNSTDNNTSNSSIVDNNNNNSTRHTRHLLNGDTCYTYCPLNAVAARAPSEAEVMDAFRTYVQEAEEEGLLTCVTSIGQCQFGTTFESSFLVAFAAPPLPPAFNVSNTTTTTIIDDDFGSGILEAALQDTLNDLLAPRVGICRPEFRLVQSVSSTIGVTLVREDERRKLQEGMDDNDMATTSHERRAQDTSLSFAPTTAPSSMASIPSGLSPSASDFPTFLSTTTTTSLSPSSVSSSEAAVTTSPTISLSNPSNILVLLSVSGICNGCTSDLLLGNQVINTAGARTRNLSGQQKHRNQGGTTILDDPFSRLLQEQSGSTTTVSAVSPADSNCFCPIESVVQEGSNNPSAEVVLDEYQDRLDEEFSSNGAVNDVLVQSFQEVQVISCEDEDVGIFDTQVTLQFTLNQDVSDGELNQLAKLIEETYNDLTDEMYCDPLIRRVDNLDIDSMTLISSSGQDGCDLYEVTFEVRGACRGCEDDSSLFFQGDDEDQRRRLNNDIPDWVGVDRDDPNHYYNENASRGGRKRRHRRRLQGSELCLCEGYTVGNRAPSLGEFEEVLEGVIERARFDLICGLSSQFQEVPITDVPSTSPSVLPSQSPTACTASLENEFSTELILFVEEDGSNVVDEDVRILLGESIQTTYNELIQAEYRVCDSLYREVISISPVLPEDEGTRRNLLRVKDKKTTQFGNHHSTNLHSRKVQEASGSGIPIGYIVSGRCESCGPDSNILDALTGDQVISRVKALSAEFMDSGILLDMQEIENIECSSDIIEFDEVVIVQLVATCPEDANFGFDDVLTTAIEETFVATYNALAALYCDEYFTVLVDAVLENVGVITEDGNIPIEIRVFAECLGCDPQEVGIYGNPSAIQRTSSDDVSNRNLKTGSGMFEDLMSLVDPIGRFLQTTNREACICSAQAVADRPPSESEFIEAFRQSVEALPLDCVSSVGECQFGSTFDTDIVLSFEGNQTSLTDEARVAIQENFMQLLNDLYEPNADVCNPDFRVVVDVALVFDFTLNGEFIESGGNGTTSDDDLVGGVRTLVGDDDDAPRGSSWGRMNQEINATTPIPSSSPSTVVGVGSGDLDTSSISPTSSPTIDLNSNLIRTLLTVSGVCNGCVNELFLSNQVSTAGRKLPEQYGKVDESERWLQGDTAAQANSNCFCPLTAIINIQPPSPDEVQGALSRRLEEEEIELVVRNIDTVSAIACDDEQETTRFTSEFTISFSALETVRDNEIQQLGDAIASVYNGLVEEYCDPLIRRDVALKLKDRSRVIASGTGEKKRVRRDLQNEDDTGTDLSGPNVKANCVNFEATFEVRGKCRGCDDGTPLLDVSNGKRRSLEVHNRILSSGGRTERTRRRHLMEVEEECFCDANTIAPRAPTLDELWLRLELELGSFVGVCGRPVDCDPTLFVSQFSETTILALLLERGTVLTEEHLLELELAYMSGYNEMQNNLRTDKCGGRFRQLSSLRADRSILGAGGGVIVEEGDNGLRYLEDLESEDGQYSSAERRRLSVQSISMVGSGDCTRDCQVGDDRDVIAGTVDLVREVSVVKEVLSVNEFLTGAPSISPSSQPSTQPSVSPSTSPSSQPSTQPSESPSTSPSSQPSTHPSVSPSTSPSTSPSSTPSTSPSTSPTSSPSTSPSSTPSTSPSTSPTSSPSTSPSVAPSSSPSVAPSTVPSTAPSTSPSNVPSLEPSSLPSGLPSNLPSSRPSLLPSQSPSTSRPSVEPSGAPSFVPTSSPTASSICDAALCSGDFDLGGLSCSTVSEDCVCNAPVCPSCIGSFACDFAESLTIGDNSCIGDFTCISATSSIGISSCNGDSACGSVTGSVVGDGSCNARLACEGMTNNVAAGSCNVQSICRQCMSDIPSGVCNDISSFPGDCGACLPGSVGSGSCRAIDDSLTCWGQVIDPSLITIGTSSCTGVDSCIRLDLTSIGNGSCTDLLSCGALTTNVVGDNACQGDRACVRAVTTSSIGSRSCVGDDACSDLATSSGDVGDDSCIGENVCSGFTGGGIGNGSCIAPGSCQDCAATVGDGECTSVGDLSCPC